MLAELKKIVLGKKRLICFVLAIVIISLAVPGFVYFQSIREYRIQMNGPNLAVEANSLRSSGNYWKAVRVYRKIAKTYPEMAPAALYEITRTYELSGGSNSQKIKAYREVIQRFPDSHEAGNSLEGLAKLSNDPIPLYQEIIRKYPDKYMAVMAVAAMLNNVLKEQRQEEAQKLCREWLAGQPAARIQIAAYKHLVFYAQQSNNIQPVTDFSYRITEDFPQTQLAESAALFLAGMNFQKGNYRESLGLWSGLEKKQKIRAEETQYIYQRIANLAGAGISSPGYIKELANLFLISGEVCDTLAGYTDNNSSDTFFADEAKSLSQNYGDVKENRESSGFTGAERSLRQEILRITDGKVMLAYQKLAPTIKNDEAQNGLVRYFYAYILATRSVSQVVAETDIFFKEIPLEFRAPVLSGLAAEIKGYQFGPNLFRETINRSPQSADAAIVLENTGDFYRQMKMYAGAMKIYRKIVSEYTEHPSAIKAQEKIIDIYARDWQVFPEAMAECFRLAKIFPESPEAIHAQLLVGKFYYFEKEYEHSLPVLQNFVTKYPRAEWVPEAYLLMALNYLSRQENNLAIAQLRTLIRKYPKNELAARAQFLIGYCFLSLQLYDDALQEFQKLVANYPKSHYIGKTRQLMEKLSGTN